LLFGIPARSGPLSVGAVVVEPTVDPFVITGLTCDVTPPPIGRPEIVVAPLAGKPVTFWPVVPGG
jgi:hypothetical protein